MQKEFVDSIDKMNKAAVEAAKRMGEIQLRTLERLTEQQIEVASDYLTGGVKHLELLGDTKDPKAAFGAQTKLATEMNEKLVDHARKTMEILTEAKSDMTALVEEGMKTASANPFVKAGKKAA